MLNWEIYDKISNQVGTSFYVASTETFKKNYNSLLNEFKKFYPNTNIAYSYKTNYLPQFCSKVNSFSGYAEVVSSMELQLALDIGVAHERIFFNGPFKEIKQTHDFLLNGGTVNIDSIEEYHTIDNILLNHDRLVKIGVRCNFDIDDGFQSRFGISEENKKLQSLLKLVNSHKNMQLVGLHCHFASRSLKSWKNRTLRMTRLILSMQASQLKNIKYVSLGGGLYGNMDTSLKSQFSNYVPSFSEYAEVSAKEFSQVMSSLGRTDIELIIEPGTAVVASALTFTAMIQSIKRIGPETFVTVNGSAFNLGTFKSAINPPVSILRNPKKSTHLKVQDAKIVGYTCIEGDVLHNNFSASIKVGDVVLFDEIGSYSIVMKPPFILPNVAIVEFNSDFSQFKIIKRKETFKDIFSTYEY